MRAREADAGGLFAHRYAIGRELGRGGMGAVHQATDTLGGRELAIKRLLQRPKDQALALALFEREFHVLSQLAHPRVVEVLDYGVSEETPFYTMELLDGGDLAGMAPMPWRDVCRVFRDVFSVLALLHSRRMVYRDLNPNNIRCTAEGTARVIDFGAMMPMGPTRKVVGTPGFTAPELLHQQSLDGRADLYAAGASMYYALTGHRPHHARDMAELAVLMLARIERPSHFTAAKDCPPELEELILELLQIDPAFRPASAAEVIDRLTDIGNLPPDELLPASGAYLVTPPLTARNAEVALVRKWIAKAARAQGATLLYESEAGAGRSRMLEAATLEAKLAGAVVAKADIGDAQAGGYGVADRLAAQLLEQHPDAHQLAKAWAEILGHVLPSMRAAFPDVELTMFEDPRMVRPAVQTALQAWVLSLCEHKTTVLVVDDLPRIDEPSLALLALLSIAARDRRLLLVASAELGVTAPSAATLATMRAHARPRRLKNLCPADTHALLMAVFGDSPQVAVASERIFSVCLGNPRDILQLAEFLVTEGIARYEGGRWLLPTKLDAQSLPTSAEDASIRTLESLSSDAQTLAQLFSLSALSSLTLPDCSAAMPESRRAGTLRALGELASANIVRVNGEHYGLSRPLWGDIVRARASAEETAHQHRRLANMMEHRGHAPIIRIHHLRHAHDDDRAVDALVAFCRASIAQTDDDTHAFHRFVSSLPDNWYGLFDWGIRSAEQLGRPHRETYAMRLRLTALLGLDASLPTDHGRALLRQLKHDAGLDLYQSLEGENLPEQERLKLALDAAQARHDTTPTAQRVLSPMEAFRPLVQTTIVLAARVVTAMDYELLAELPELRPLEPFSPMIAVVRGVVDGLRHRLSARFEQAEASYAGVLESLAQPNHGGVNPVHAKYTQLGITKGLAMTEAALGLDKALERARALKEAPLMELNAGIIQMLHCYFDASPRKGDDLKRTQILVRIKESAVQFYEGAHLLMELVAHSAAKDAPRLRDALAELESHARHHAGWRPVLLYGQAELAMLHGRHAVARHQLEDLLAGVKAGQHQIWCNAAGAHSRSVVGTGQPQEAVQLCQRYLDEARQASVGINEIFLRIPLSAARLAAGDHEGARREADAVIQLLEARGIKGLLAGNIREISARIAIAQEHVERAHQDLDCCTRHFRADTNRRGRQRCEALVRALGDSPRPLVGDGLSAVTALRSELRSRVGRSGRGPTIEGWYRSVARVLGEETGASAAAVFVPDLSTPEQVRTLRCVAFTGSDRDDREMAEAADALFVLVSQSNRRSHDRDDADFATQTSLGDLSAPSALEAFVLSPDAEGPPSVAGLVALRGLGQRPAPELLEALGRLMLEAQRATTSRPFRTTTPAKP